MAAWAIPALAAQDGHAWISPESAAKTRAKRSDTWASQWVQVGMVVTARSGDPTERAACFMLALERQNAFP